MNPLILRWKRVLSYVPDAASARKFCGVSGGSTTRDQMVRVRMERGMKGNGEMGMEAGGNARV
jgi:hypothetical protein